MRRALLALLACTAFAAANDLEPQLRAALVRVHVTSQSYDLTEPWKKRPVRARAGRGVMIAPGIVLTPSSLVRDALTVEVAVANSARRYAARLKHADHRLGLAQIEITDDDLKGRMAPLPLGDPIRLDDECDLYQLGNDNIVERYTARVQSASASDTTLRLRLKTTLSDAGNGQVAVKNGKVVGLVIGTVRSRQEGTILPVETLRKYLDDFADDTYHGCPSPGLWVQSLLRDDLRAYYGLKPGQHGLAVTRVMPGRTGDGVIRAGDVLLEVAGYDIDDEGKFVHEVHGRLNASYLFQGLKYAGETIQAKILRGGEVMDVEFELKSWPVTEMQVPTRAPGGRPQFIVVGGLVILELTGAVSISRSEGGVILRRYKERALWEPDPDRRRIVFVDHVLQDKSNKGFERLRHATIETVNGVRIQEIADVAKALEKPLDGFHVFHFEGVASDFVIPAAERDEIDDRVAKTYKVTRTRYLHGDEE